MCKSVAITVAALLLMAGTARASPVVNPDLTIYFLDVAYDGTNLNVVSDPISLLSWTLPDGSLGGVDLGIASLTWNGTTGSFGLSATQSLAGTVVGLLVNGAGTAFEADVLLSQTGYSLGDHVHVFVADETGQADVIPVPEPATLAMLLLGGGAAAWRKRRSMTPTQS
jgi:hypothetical protein